MKNKIILNTLLIFSLSVSKNSVAEISYAGKFLNTTATGCAVGLGSGLLIGEYGGYDPKTKQSVTWMGAVTGCLSATVFSYFFYDDQTKDLIQRNEQLQHINNQLQLQLQAQINNGTLQNQKFLTNNNTISLILENMQIAKIDPEKIGGVDNLIFGLKKCDAIYPLWMDKNGFVHSNNDKIALEDSWIPVSPHFALKSWQFYYSKDGCFEEDKKYGYFENIMPGLSSQLENQLRYTITAKEKN
ncbi:hypothetical protein [Spirobacillus cienkowskii]|uniref:hypothetical protein n=1 Tax=Spirobacillus cienkowskii TaxID=495820 RepID=UPI0030CEF028